MNLNESIPLVLAKRALDGINSVQKQMNTTLKQNLDLLPSADDTWDIGAADNTYKDLYLGGNADISGGLTVSGGGESGHSVTLTTIRNSANAIYLHANGGSAETIKIYSDRGTSATSVNIVSDEGGITLTSSSAVAVTNSATVGGTLAVTSGTTVGGSFDVDGATTLDSVTIDTTDGDFSVSGANKITLGTTNNNASAISLTANGGSGETIKIHSELGTNDASVNIVSDVGGITLNASKAVAVTNNASVGGTLTVTGTTTASSLAVTGGATVGTTLGVTGNTTVGGTLGITGATTASSLAVTGGATVGTTLGVTSNTTVGGTLDVTGATTLSKVTASTASGDFSVFGANKITLGTSYNNESAISLTTNGGTSETLLIKNTLGSSATAINIVSSAGGITLNGTSGVSVPSCGMAVTGGALTYKANVVTTTDATSLSSSLTGTIVLISGEHAVTLPTPFSGGYFKIITTAPSNGAQILKCDTAAIKFIGTYWTNVGVPTTTYNDTTTSITLISATPRGVTAECVSDGSSWYVNMTGVNTTNTSSIYTVA